MVSKISPPVWVVLLVSAQKSRLHETVHRDRFLDIRDATCQRGEEITLVGLHRGRRHTVYDAKKEGGFTTRTTGGTVTETGCNEAFTTTIRSAAMADHGAEAASNGCDNGLTVKTSESLRKLARHPRGCLGGGNDIAAPISPLMRSSRASFHFLHTSMR